MIKEINFSKKAVERINQLISKKPTGTFFRIAVKGGGCSGFKYDCSFDNKIDKNDVPRSIRAYEIKYQTKKSIFDWFKKTKNFFSSDEFIKIYIDYPREELIQKINLRNVVQIP